MADCNDLFQRRQELQAQKADAQRQLDEGKRSIDLDKPPEAAGKPVIFRTRKAGERVEMTTDEVTRQLQYALKQAQGSQVAEQVARGMAIDEKPQGSLGRMFNYSRVVPDKENVAKLMEAFSITRLDLQPGLHKNLTRTYTKEDAAQMLLGAQQEFLKDRDGMLQEMVRQVRGLEYLPEIVTRVRVVKEDAVGAFLDAGDAMVRQALENPGLPVDVNLTNDAWAAGRWALITGELDSFAARKVAQAQVSRQFGALSADRLFDDFDPDSLIKQKRNEIDPKTLMGQIMLHIDSGDIQGLRNMLSRARSLKNAGELDLKADWFNQHLRDISVLRKDGMLSGLQTLAYRNPVSGAAMFVTGAYRQAIDASLRVGTFKGAGLALTSMRETLSHLDVGWRLARNSWTDGKSVMDLNIERLAAEGANSAPDADAVIDRLLTAPYTGNAVQRAAVGYGRLYASWRLLLSDVVGQGKIPKLPALRALGAADEIVRWAAYTNSVRLGAEVDALETLGKDASKQAVDEYVQNAINEATFRGTVTAEDLKAYRRVRGASAAQAPDAEITQRIANELVGAPTLSTKLSQDALEESRRVTGTQDYPDNPGGRFLGAIDRYRNQSWQVDLLIPFFRNPINMAMFTVDTAFPVRPATTLAYDAGRAIYERLTKGSTDIKANRLAIAQVTLSGTLFGAWAAGTAAGQIRGGGPKDPKKKAEWLRFNRPYSIGPSGEKSAQMSLAGIDPFDVLFTWSDLHELASEGQLSIYDQDTIVTGIGEALARIVRRKSGFATVSRFLEWMNDPSRTKITDVAALAASSFVPQIGNMRDAARLNEPDDRPLRTRAITAEERYALGDDRLNSLVASLKDFTYQAVPPIAAMANAPRERDWLGTKMERPFGLSVDAVIPFMPVLMPDSPVHKWLLDNGVIMKPRAKGVLEGVTMTPEMEGNYRDYMANTKAPEGMPPSARLSLAGIAGTVSYTAKKTVMVTVNRTKMPVSESVTQSVDITPIVDRLTKGRNMHDALLALKNDPWYQSIEADADLSSRPDLRDLPKSMRAKGVTQKLVNTIVSYYDQLAMDRMRNSAHPADLEWHQKELVLKDGGYKQNLESILMTLPRIGAGFTGL
jgi:hypothetical protein